MGTELSEIVHREPLGGVGNAVTGAWLERGQLTDGRPVVLKHLPADGDWLTRATGGIRRARWLWESGLLARVAHVMDHPVIDVLREDDHDVVVMDDVSPWLLTRTTRASPRVVSDLLAGLAALHDQWEEWDLDGLCSPADRNGIFRPAFHRSDDGSNPFPRRGAILAGWDAFAAHVPADVVDAVSAVHADLTVLDPELAAVPATLLHGDAKLDNLGLRDRRLLAVDWSELTGTGPAEMDLVWFAMTATAPRALVPGWALDGMPDELFCVYAEHSSRPLEARALDAACIGMLAQFGWLLTGVAHLSGWAHDETTRARAAVLLDWWVARVRSACERWSPA